MKNQSRRKHTPSSFLSPPGTSKIADPSSRLWKTWTNTVQKAPAKWCLVDGTSGSLITREELLRRCEEIVVPLSESGQNLHRKVIAICLPNGPEWLSVFLGLQKLGAVPLLLDHTLSPEAQINTSKLLKADFLFRDGKCIAITKSIKMSPLISAIKVTSGTTGQLKPVPVTSDELLADGHNIVSTMRIKPSDRSLALIPFGHAYGLGNLVLPLILQGTPIVYAREFVPRQIPIIIQKMGVTIFPGVPALFRILTHLDAERDLGKLRLVISAGAFLPSELARSFYSKYDLKIHNFYGSTETGAIAFDRTGSATLSGRAVGQPMRNVIVKSGDDGKIAVKSKAVAASQTNSQGTFILPDLGKILPGRRGELLLMGRMGTVANIGGKKVHPAEVEACIRKVSKVNDAWVTVLKDQHGNDFLAAAVESDQSIFSLEDSLQKHLPSWKLPKQYYIRSCLPRTARGKLNTQVIMAQLQGLPKNPNPLPHHASANASPRLQS